MTGRPDRNLERSVLTNEFVVGRQQIFRRGVKLFAARFNLNGSRRRLRTARFDDRSETMWERVGSDDRANGCLMPVSNDDELKIALAGNFCSRKDASIAVFSLLISKAASPRRGLAGCHGVV